VGAGVQAKRPNHTLLYARRSPPSPQRCLIASPRSACASRSPRVPGSTPLTPASARADKELGIGKRHQELGLKKWQAANAEEQYQKLLAKKYASAKESAGGPEAVQAVEEAYDVLKDESKRALYDQGGKEAVQAGAVVSHKIRFVSEECRVILERVVKAELAMHVFFSRDEDEIFVMIGAAEHILMDEASYAPDPEQDEIGNKKSGNPMELPLKLKYKNPETGEKDDRPNGTLHSPVRPPAALISY
jgi:hypothetical protein